MKRVREVVLLTDDRNLRVKALAAELPARDLPSFVQWAGLAQDAVSTTLLFNNLKSLQNSNLPFIMLQHDKN